MNTFTVLLDSRYVEPDQIDPSKHRFIGMFRLPAPPQPLGYVLCNCGMTLQTVNQVRDHYLIGHFDLNQYVTIEKDEKK